MLMDGVEFRIGPNIELPMISNFRNYVMFQLLLSRTCI